MLVETTICQSTGRIKEYNLLIAEKYSTLINLVEGVPLDSRVFKHAEIIVNWSTQVMENDMVLIRAYPEAHDLVVALAGEIAKKKASYLVLMESDESLSTYLEHADNQTLSLFPRHYKSALDESDVVILIIAPSSKRALADASSEKLAMRARTRESLFDLFLSKRWCDTIHPCDVLAQEAGMNLNEYKDLVYDAILIDWEHLSKEMSILSKLLNKYQDIHLLGSDTDFYAETTGRVWMLEDGKHNMPSGEVYVSPLEKSVEGTIYFNIPFLHNGKQVEGVRLQFENGSVVDYSAERGEQTLKSIIELDDGSRHLGEIAIGMNRGISKYTKNMLFDEKMGDTVHCALGKALKECGGENKSAIHVDMVKNMLDGEIIAGGVTIYKRGKFLY